MIKRHTFAIIKPDAVANGAAPFIIHRILKARFSIVAYEERLLTDELARVFYAIHNDQPWFDGLIEFMTEGTCFTLILERDDAVNKWRDLMVKLRGCYGLTVTRNAVHGSDANVTAGGEIKLMFPDCYSRIWSL